MRVRAEKTPVEISGRKAMIEKQTNFGKISTKLPLPDLLDMQNQSFVDFLQLDVAPSKRE